MVVLSRLPSLVALSCGALAAQPSTAAPADPPASVPAMPTASTARSSEGRSAWSFRRADGTVHQAFQRWAREAGWQLVWDVDRDFPIDAEVTLHGDFLEALHQAMEALRDTDFPLQARVQADSRVLRIGRWLPDGVRR